KFARRNKAPLIAAGLLAVVMLGALGLLAVSNVLIGHEQARTAYQRDLATDRARSLEWQLYVSRINRAHGEWSANNVAEAEQLLDACPEALRGWEWHYVKRLCHLDLLSYRGHTRAVTDVAFSPDGTRVVSGAGGGWVSTQAVWSDSSSFRALVEA